MWIRSHCGYASEVWAPSSIVNLKKVESLQRRATRFILPNSDLNYRDRLIKLNLIPLSYWHEIKDLVFFFKCLKGLYNFPINNFVKSKQSTRFTRNNCPLDMSVPLCKTKLFQTSYFNRIPKMWNALTPSIRCCSSVSTFRSAVYNHYSKALKSAFYPDNPLSWKSICPKCCAPRDVLSPPKCCP